MKCYCSSPTPSHWPGQWEFLNPTNGLPDFSENYILWADSDLIYYHQGKPFFSATECYQTVKTGQHTLILKAVERKGKLPVQVLDGTAGWGREALTLALAGIAVTAVEQSLLPVLFMHYAKDFLFPASLSFTIVHQNFQDYTQNHPQVHWPCVYLDPLFFDSKASLSKKAMELLYTLPESENLSQEVHDRTLKCALLSLHIQTLVIKQHRQASPWFEHKTFVHSSKTTKTCRFDVFYINESPITPQSLGIAL